QTGANAVWYLAADLSVTDTVPLATTDIDEPHMVAVADFDQDGHADLVLQDFTTGEVSIDYMKNTSLVTHQIIALADSALVPWHVQAVGDMNGDGVPDL
ncbi:FG-GAP repeat domain-containing protein, partial [Klebsiella pneumoniae]